MAAVCTCQQAGAGRGTDGGSRIALGETHAVLGQLVDVGSFEFFLSVATQVAVSQVIRQDEYHIRFFVFVFLCMHKRNGCNQAGSE